jgi:hypothetical protein
MARWLGEAGRQASRHQPCRVAHAAQGAQGAALATNLVPQAFLFCRPQVPEGTYTVKMIRGNDSPLTKVELVHDPRSTHTPEDRAVQQQTVHRLYRELESLIPGGRASGRARPDACLGADNLAAGDPTKKKLTTVADKLSRRWRVAGRHQAKAARSPARRKLRERLGWLYGAVNGYEGRPTNSQLGASTRLAEVQTAQTQFDALTGKELAPPNTAPAPGLSRSR